MERATIRELSEAVVTELARYASFHQPRARSMVTLVVPRRLDK